MKLGSEVLEQSKNLRELKKKRVALLAHPASVNKNLIHSSLVLKKILKENFVCAFGPQHGIRGEKQDNMEESQDIIDPTLGIPVYSLYGKTRRPTKEMIDQFDILLVDLQDVGTRIYTFITTLFYMLEALHNTSKEIWILDRPNPAGRSVEGFCLDPKMISFVGCSEGLILRHGLTLGELTEYFKEKHSFNVQTKIFKIQNYKAHLKPGWGWPTLEFPWVNPSPNIPRLSSVRAFPGTVLIEGTLLSEGRGTTRPLELLGAPDINGDTVLKEMEKLNSKWMQGCLLRPCYFEPTFQKHTKQLCSGFQIHTDYEGFNPQKFKPFRLVCLALKAIKNLYPEKEIWNRSYYEYEKDRLSFDLICGTTLVREWVEDSRAKPGDLEKLLILNEKSWLKTQKKYFLYR